MMGAAGASLIGGGVSGGQGVIDLSGGPATSGAEGGRASAGGQQFNFAPPMTAMTTTVDSLQMPLIVAGAAVIVWVLARKR